MLSRLSPGALHRRIGPPPSRPPWPYVRDIFPVPRHAAWYINNAWAQRLVSRSVIWLRRRRFKSLAPTFPHGRDHNGTYTHTQASAADRRRTRGEKARKENTKLHRVAARAVERGVRGKKARGRFSRENRLYPLRQSYHCCRPRAISDTISQTRSFIIGPAPRLVEALFSCSLNDNDVNDCSEGCRRPDMCAISRTNCTSRRVTVFTLCQTS